MDSFRAILPALGVVFLVGIGCFEAWKGKDRQAKRAGVGVAILGIGLGVLAFGLPSSEQEKKREEAGEEVRKLAARLEARWDVIDETRDSLAGSLCVQNVLRVERAGSDRIREGWKSAMEPCSAVPGREHRRGLGSGCARGRATATSLAEDEQLSKAISACPEAATKLEQVTRVLPEE